MDDRNLPVQFNDVDYCLKAREQKYLIVYTPYAELIHHESATRGLHFKTPEEATSSKKEYHFFREKWIKYYKYDPYYNSDGKLVFDASA